MKDWARIFWLEEEADELLLKIERVKKHNENRSRVGREGMHDQIENFIRIDQNRREAMLEEIEELKKAK